MGGREVGNWNYYAQVGRALCMLSETLSLSDIPSPSAYSLIFIIIATVVSFSQIDF